MQEGVFITPQEAMEPLLNEALIEYESRLRLKAVKIKLGLPRQIAEEHEHVRDTTHPLNTTDVYMLPAHCTK